MLDPKRSVDPRRRRSTDPGRAAVRDGRRRRIPARAARRWPPKRCRIIGIGDRMQYRSAATRASLERLSLAARGGSRAPVSISVERRVAGPMVRRPCEVGPVGVEYLVRAARITDIDRLVALSDGVVRCVRARGPARTRPICSASSSTCRRRASSSPRRGATSSVARSSPSGRRSAPAATSARSTSWSSIPTHDVDRVTEALLEEVLRSASNKGCTVVEAPLPDDPAARTRWERHGFVASRSAHPTNRGRGGAAARPEPMNIRAPSSAIAPARANS